jgi:hypothetical protein
MPTRRTRHSRTTSSRLHRSPSGPHGSQSNKPPPLPARTPRLRGHGSPTAGKCCPSRRTLLAVGGGLLLLVNGPSGVGNTKGSHLGSMSRLCGLLLSAILGRFPSGYRRADSPTARGMFLVRTRGVADLGPGLRAPLGVHARELRPRPGRARRSVTCAETHGSPVARDSWRSPREPLRFNLRFSPRQQKQLLR